MPVFSHRSEPVYLSPFVSHRRCNKTGELGYDVPMSSNRTPLLLLYAVLALAAISAAQTSEPSSSSSSSRSSKSAKHSVSGQADIFAGSVVDGVYRNHALAVSCKIPAGWVLRTEEMNAQGDGGAHPNVAASAAGKSGRVLLAAFSRPPEAHGEDVNSSILIAAESAASYPGLKDAPQYFGPVTEIARAQGFEMEDEPYKFVLGTKTLARGDYQKDVGSRVMRQSTLVMLARGYAVSFTFIGGTEDEVEELVQGLSFGTANPAH